MSIISLIAGAVIVLVTLWDAFETIVLPRTVQRRVRLTRLIVRMSWLPWAFLMRLPLGGSRRDAILALYGPLLLIFLLGIWAVGLIVGFGLLLHGVAGAHSAPLQQSIGLWTAVYLSGTTLFTLGLGDVTPWNAASRIFMIIESGIGLGFLAMVVAYLPIFYQAFARREVAISLLDAHAGSPPTAIELIRRNRDRVADGELRDWELWSAELLESHLSYPILAFFRSQHERQSWLGALLVILDTSALIMTGIDGISERQARFSFAIARHALVDLAQIFYASPDKTASSRLTHDGFVALRARLDSIGLGFNDDDRAEQTLSELRRGYESIAAGLGKRLLFELPPWIPVDGAVDDWQTSPWDTLPSI